MLFVNQITPSICPRVKSEQRLNLQEKLSCSTEQLKSSEHSFIFLITGTGQLLYGVCVSVDEPLSVLQTLYFLVIGIYLNLVDNFLCSQ